MDHVLKICDLETYADSQGQLERENAMTIEYASLLKKKKHEF